MFNYSLGLPSCQANHQKAALSQGSDKVWNLKVQKMGNKLPNLWSCKRKIEKKREKDTINTKRMGGINKVHIITRITIYTSNILHDHHHNGQTFTYNFLNYQILNLKWPLPSSTKFNYSLDLPKQNPIWHPTPLFSFRN